MLSEVRTTEKTTCYHCGDECRNERISFDSKVFCCDGCKLVYEILQENNLCTYYQFNTTPGLSQQGKRVGYRQAAILDERFAFLEDATVIQKLINFTDGQTTVVSFSIPQMHCSSCIWLLEHLNRINKGVSRSQVNFLKHEVSITYNEKEISLRKLVEMLTTIGYEPLINLDDLEKKRNKKKDYRPIYKIGVAGFCFGNIMLFSFPEYFSSGNYVEHGFKGVFSYLNFALSLPVFFYCSRQFFQSAWQGLKAKYLNIDVPIALGILVMFLRSSFEIISNSGPGYMDTMAGLVFFMLAGRMFQNKTYDTISFERDYKSFFPVSVMIRKENRETSIPVSQLTVGDRIIIRNEELIPADSILMKGEARIDYSFVTGEAAPVVKKNGELIYAGGKQQGTSIELEVVKNVSQSYLTQLWNNDAYHLTKDENKFQQLVNRISHYFTIGLISIAVASLGWWLFMHDFARGMNAFTAVLIIACPCALAISSPFTLGNILRIFGRNKFYLKNFSVIEKLAKVDTIVFDKTGTLTNSSSSKIEFIGKELNTDEQRMIRSLAFHSSHPLSRAIYNAFDETSIVAVSEFKEVPGIGIEGTVFDLPVKLASGKSLGQVDNDLSLTKVYVVIAENIPGYFALRNQYREGLDESLNKLKKSNYKLAVLSGDHEGERNYLKKIFGDEVEINFNQQPQDKLNYIKSLQRNNHKVLMIGDGLNDAGALKQSDVGISISENINNFSPACDGILDGSMFSSLPQLLNISRSSHHIILRSFVIAIVYNIIGLSFAVAGHLSPVVAAILMPISSVTIIAFTTGFSNWVARTKS